MSMPLPRLRALLASSGDEQCQHCGAGIASEHRHIVDIARRVMRCVCEPCHAGALVEPGGPHRAVPTRYVRLPGAALADAQWDACEIPVGIAFLLRNSVLGRAVALYPSPAGVTESLLSPTAWEGVLDATAAVGGIVSDVEALLVRRTPEERAAFLVPIDACYELAGRVRRSWRGFGGGSGAAHEIDAFFARVSERAARAQ